MGLKHFEFSPLNNKAFDSTNKSVISKLSKGGGLYNYYWFVIDYY
jgi:hypothetical protein